MRLYLASRFVRQNELRMYAAWLRREGHVVNCRWLGENHDLGPDAPVGEGARLALDDWEDLQAADLVIVFTGDTSPGRGRGGYHVETGLALAWSKPLVIVGPRENVFHYLPQVRQFDSWGDLPIRRLGEVMAKS